MAGAMRETLVRFGRLDCLVANAGTTGKQSFTDMSLGEWHRVLQVNLDGAFLCLREAARVLVGQGQGGSLVGVSSTSAIDGAPGQQPARYDTVDQALTVLTVDQALDKLPSIYSDVMRLVRDGLTHSEIAERLGIPIGTVKSRMAKATDTLRAELANLRGGDDAF